MRSYGRITQLLVRRPSRTKLNLGIVTHQARQQIDTDVAFRQWTEYVRTIAVHSRCEVILCPEADDLPDGVFVEDAVVYLGKGSSVLTNPGSDSRKQEVLSVRTALERARIGKLESIASPGTLDGGDVLVVPPLGTLFVGQSARTNDEGIEQLAVFARSQGLRVCAVPVRNVLHLKSAVTALPDGRLIAWLPGLDKDGLAALPSILAMPEEQGAHVVVLDQHTLLVSAAAPLSVRLLQGLGYRVLVVDISEFEKLDGCVTCLSVRLRT